PPGPHSIPTRRSSDLAAEARYADCARALGCAAADDDDATAAQALVDELEALCNDLAVPTPGRTASTSGHGGRRSARWSSRPSPPARPPTIHASPRPTTWPPSTVRSTEKGRPR